MQFYQLKKHLKPGEVYRRAELKQRTTAVDRNLQQLVGDGTLEKLSANEHELVSSFLKDNRFVLTSPSDYNALGVGTTQLYNERRVYNQKRHGVYKLGNRIFRFTGRIGWAA